MRRITWGSGCTLVAAGLFAAPALAAPIVDGTKDVDYGTALAVQQNSTGFGDNSDATVGFANGSELDAAYAAVANGRLYVLLTGNLESNFNKLDIFIDSAAGGQGTLGSLTSNQGNFNNMTGLTFDTGFAADHWISINGGFATPDIFADYANLVGDQAFFAGQSTPTNGALSGGTGGPVIEATWNNSNTAGVTGSTAPNDAASVLTGIEFSIALADLNYVDGDIRISAFVNNGDHNYLSNQVLGSLPSGTGNLGGDGSGNFTGNAAGIDFNDFTGDQFFTIPENVIPEPSSLALAALGAPLMLRRRR